MNMTAMTIDVAWGTNAILIHKPDPLVILAQVVPVRIVLGTVLQVTFARNVVTHTT
jgi:hypothetical protein